MPKPAARAFRPVVLALLFVLCGCASYGSLFSYDREPARPASAETTAVTADQSCLHTADLRATDAVTAGYVAEGSPQEGEIRDATYRNCEKWRPRGSD